MSRINFNPDQTVDEIVLENCTAHLEQCSGEMVYLGLEQQGKLQQIWIQLERGSLVVRTEGEIFPQAFE